MEAPPSPSNNGTPFRFLDLPTELRECVYEFVPELRATTTPKVPQQLEKLRYPAVTRICSTVREETLPLFYQNATITTDNTSFAHTPAFRDTIYRRPGQRLLRRSLDTVVGNNVKHLRSVCIEDHDCPSVDIAHPSKSGISSMDFAYSVKTGIEMSVVVGDPRYSLEFRAKLKALVTKINLVKADGCDGKMLIETVCEALDILSADDG